MPVSKPGTLPRWSETAGGTQSNISPAPSSGAQDVGFAPGQKPPNSWHNWLFNLIYRWLAYVNDLENQAIIWVGVQTFSARPVFNDGILVNAASTSNRPGIDSTGKGTGAAYKGTASSTAGSSAFEGAGAGNNPAARFTGAGTGAGATLTGGSSGGPGATIAGGASNGHGADVSSSGSGPAVNASTTGSGTAVVADASGGTGTALNVAGNSSAAAATFAGGGTQKAATFANGTAATGSTRRDAAAMTNGDLDLSGVTNPDTTTGLTNRLAPSLVPKAWGFLDISNATPFVVTLTDGANIASVARGTSQRIDVTFAAAMANGSYAVVANMENVVGVAIHPINPTTGGFSLVLSRDTGTLTIDSLATSHLYFVVMGRQ